ncbi:MAG: hypothetical protein RR543_04830 [Erysipelotrichales bacterium]
MKNKLELQLFSMKEITMKDIMSTTKISDHSLRDRINVINEKMNYIQINKEHKPYIYSLDLKQIAKL